MRLSVIIPTFRRPHLLMRCLNGLKEQHRIPDEVLIGIREEDEETRNAVGSYDAGILPLRMIDVGNSKGVAEARDKCLEAAGGDILAMCDDDAIPRPNWTQLIHEQLTRDPGLGGVGGPDWMNGREIPLEERASVVGRIQWCGRVVGNHHCGAREPQIVNCLKGTNMSFRREAIIGRKFARLVHGVGAQYAEELGVQFAIQRSGWRLLYDPMIQVDHIHGPLTAGVDHRRFGEVRTLIDSCHNETAAVLSYLSPFQRVAFFLWSMGIGKRVFPGALMAVYMLLSAGQISAFKRCWYVWIGRLQGWQTWLHDSHDPPNGPSGSKVS